MVDRLRDLLDLIIESLDDPGADGSVLAGRAHFSREHLDRIVRGAVGETAVALRRRLLLERAAWQLRERGIAPGEVGARAGYGSPEAFSRAFTRAYGVPPRSFAASGLAVALDAPNGIHFHGPDGFLLPASPGAGSPTPDRVAGRMLAHHVERCRALLVSASALPAEALARPLRPGLVILAFEGEEPSASVLARRLVYTLEVWVAAIGGHDFPPDLEGDLAARLDHAGRAFMRLVRDIATRGAWDDAFVDALCEPPQSFTYGGVLAHVLSFGAIRREALAGVLAELGAPPPGVPADPIAWEATR